MTAARRVLVVQSFWGKSSNRFLVRQLEMLRRRDALAAVGVLYPTAARSWRGVPVVSLSDPRGPAGTIRWLLRGLARRLGASPSPLLRRPEDGFRELLASVAADAILCQYATTAVVLQDVLSGASEDLFIHLHGFDTFEGMCPDGHREAVLALSDRAVLICNSETTRGRMLGWGVPADRLVVKYPGVEVPETPPDRAGGDGITILHLGRLVPVKGVDRTIRAFELACDRGLDGRLVVAGDGPMRSECEKLCGRSEWGSRIEIVGSVTWQEGERLRRSADVFTQHNLSEEVAGQVESFGVSVVEAMASGLPVVGTASGGVLETVVHGETGALVEPEDVDAQAGWFLRLGTDAELRESLGRAGWRRARDRFTVRIEEDRLMEIIGSGPPPRTPGRRA